MALACLPCIHPVRQGYAASLQPIKIKKAPNTQKISESYLKGLVDLAGLNDDQVLFNFTTSGKNINLNTSNSSYPNSAFHGIILAPNDVLSMKAANLDGRFFGGNSGDMKIVSHDNIIDLPAQVPEPSSLALFSVGLAVVFFRYRRRIFA